MGIIWDSIVGPVHKGSFASFTSAAAHAERADKRPPQPPRYIDQGKSSELAAAAAQMARGV